MKTIDAVRLGLGALIVYVALYGTPNVPVLPQPYVGVYGDVHDVATQMDGNDRQGLSEALVAASRMLASDKAGLVKTTEDLQRFIRGTVAFGYTSFTLNKYPKVSAAIQNELEKTVGPTVQTVSGEMRDKTVEALVELGRAVK